MSNKRLSLKIQQNCQWPLEVDIFILNIRHSVLKTTEIGNSFLNIFSEGCKFLELFWAKFLEGEQWEVWNCSEMLCVWLQMDVNPSMVTENKDNTSCPYECIWLCTFTIFDTSNGKVARTGCFKELTMVMNYSLHFPFHFACFLLQQSAIKYYFPLQCMKANLGCHNDCISSQVKPKVLGTPITFS